MLCPCKIAISKRSQIISSTHLQTLVTSPLNIQWCLEISHVSWSHIQSFSSTPCSVNLTSALCQSGPGHWFRHSLAALAKMDSSTWPEVVWKNVFLVVWWEEYKMKNKPICSVLNKAIQHGVDTYTAMLKPSWDKRAQSEQEATDTLNHRLIALSPQDLKEWGKGFNVVLLFSLEKIQNTVCVSAPRFGLLPDVRFQRFVFSPFRKTVRWQYH